MRHALAILALTLAFGIPSTGCSNACEELADISCANSGEGSEDCKKIRLRAERTSSDDKRACAELLGVVSEFSNQQ